MLQAVHERCLDWARKHGALITPDKYFHVHFTKARSKHNNSYPLALPASTLNPIPSACILSVILDKKLSWQLHLQHIKSKLTTQTNVLERLTASTWRAFPQVSRLLYMAILHPAITTTCPAWWASPNTLYFQKEMKNKLQKVKNQCLRAASSAYKATPV